MIPPSLQQRCLLLASLIIMSTFMTCQGAADASAHETCFLLRLRDRNMHLVQQAALRAAGLDAGAGQYLTPAQVANLAGRTPDELLRLSTFVSEAGGTLELVGDLRDAASACFGQAASRQLSLQFPAENASPAHRQLVLTSASTNEAAAPFSATTRVLQRGAPYSAAANAASAAAAALATSLASSMPSHVTDLVHFIAPTSMPPAPDQQQPATAESRQAGRLGRGGGGGSRRHATLGSSGRWVGALTPADVDSGGPAKRLHHARRLSQQGGALDQGALYVPLRGPYPGTTLTYSDVPFAYWFGARYNSRRAAMVSMLGFDPTSPFVFYGTSNYSFLMSHINTQPFLLTLMLPTAVQLTSSSASNGGISLVTYATLADPVAIALDVSFSKQYAAFGLSNTTHQVKAIPASAISVTTCGAVVRASRGKLPSDLCARLSRDLAVANNVANDIGDATAVYTLNVATAAALPTYVALTSLQLDMCVEIVKQPPPPGKQGVEDSSSSATNSSSSSSTTSARGEADVGGGAAAATKATAAAAAPPSFARLCMNHDPLDSLVSIGSTNTPAYLRKLYNVPPPPSRKLQAAKGLLAAVAFGPGFGYTFSRNDLSLASAAFGGPNPIAVEDLVKQPYFVPDFPSVLYGPGESPADETGLAEAAIDIQMITHFGAGSGVSYGFGSSPNSPKDCYDLCLYQATLGLKPLPDILSWSFNFEGSDPGVEATMAKFAALGVTLLAASGDSGAIVPKSRCEIALMYPAASPWVTAVGAAMMARPTPDGPVMPVACMSVAGGTITSGGGFGDISLDVTPTWQAEAVQQYIRIESKLRSWPLQPDSLAGYTSSWCNATGGACVFGRGYPDVALIGDGTPAMLSAAPEAFSGTSISAPAFAGLVAQLNAAVRATPGLECKKLGFLNPFLYWAAGRYADAFVDITVGTNRFGGGGNTPLQCAQGYSARVGWDAVTGLGMPNVKVLQRAAVEYVKLQAKASTKASTKKPPKPCATKPRAAKKGV